MKTNTLARSLRCVSSGFAITSLILCAIASPANAAIRYVKQDATGANNGTSWTNAYISLQSALSAAVSGDQVWVAAFTYRPSTFVSQTVTFTMKDGVSVYGGFNGTETLLSQRNPAINVTILTGDLMLNDTPRPAWPSLPPGTWSDNCYHVVSFPSSSPYVLDGFTITAGYASHATDPSHRSSAGIRALAAAGGTLRNCIIANNVAKDSSGGMNLTGTTQALDCTFLQNSANSDGGATISSASAVLNNCDFVQNTATIWSGALTVNVSASITDCDFIENRGTTNAQGGAIRFDSGSAVFTNCLFQGNIASNGGALGILFGSPVFNGCVFEDNLANGTAGNSGFGGAVYLFTTVSPASPSFDDCQFLDNSANKDGGAIALKTSANGTLNLVDCTVNSNIAGLSCCTLYSGGGIYQSGGNLYVEETDISFNSADDGAGVYFAGTITELTNCTLVQNVGSSGSDGLEASSSTLILDGVTLSNNGNSEILAASTTILAGGLQLFGESLMVDDISVAAGYGLSLDTTSLMQIGFSSSTTPGVVTLSGPITGTGDIFLTRYMELRVLASGSIDLSGQLPDQACVRPINTSGWGAMTLDGALRITGGTVQSSKIIVNNDTTVASCGNETGGRITLTNSASTLRCNEITTHGDRYATYSPALSPDIENNKVVAVMTPDSNPGKAGELFELRQHDDCAPNCSSTSLNYLAASDPAYTSPWALEELRLLQGARVNLINRPNALFEGAPESLFVKKIVLYEDATLNTAFQRVYYSALENEFGQPLNPQSLPPNRHIRDIPLLGFSLGVIHFENNCEFDVRIAKRLQGVSGAGTISRITSSTNPPIPAGSGGIMEMKTLTADSIAAKGIFNKLSEYEVIISFKYMFPDAAGPADLRVYLSDDPTVSTSLTPVATITRPTTPTDPGGHSSGKFGLFHAQFPRGTLDLNAGVYVELELRGAGSRVWIDDWDPVVCAWCACGDFSSGCETCPEGQGDSACDVVEVDYLYLLSEFGQPVGSLNNCADEMSPDNYIDMSDLLAWSSLFHDEEALNLCNSDALASFGGTTTAVNLPSSMALVAGKPAAVAVGDTLPGQDMLYPVDMQTHAAQAGLAAPGEKNGVRSGNGRLLADGARARYQLHGVLGLIRLDNVNSTVVLKPSSITDPPITPALPSGTQVRVGLTSSGGYPLADAAFAPGSSNIVYVTPVQVQLPGGVDPYRATAQVQLTTNGNYNVLALYGSNPAAGSTVSCVDCVDVVYQPDMSRVRELEVDAYGNLFVASAQRVNDNNYIMIYPAGGGAGIPKSLAGQVEAPAALHVEGDKLYVSTSVDGADQTDTVIYRYNIVRDAGNNATDLSSTFEAVINIAGVRFLTAMATNPADSSLWAVGFSADFCSAQQCSADLDCPGGCSFSNFLITAVPKLTIVTNPDGASPSPAVSTISGSDLALPLSVTILPAACATGDFDGGGMGMSDVPLFTAALLTPTAPTLCPGDMNLDGALNGKDIQPFCDALIP